MNHYLGQKVAIVSPKAQTTRNCIRGILTEPDYQIVFLDTPGIHKPKSKLNDFMMKTQQQASDGVDFTAVILDVSQEIGQTDEHIIRQYASPNTAIVLNKTDCTDKQKIMDTIVVLSKFELPIIPVSATTGEGCDELLKVILEHLEEGPKYFPEDMVCDYPERFLAAEMIREKALLHLSDEIPHGIGVSITEMKERQNGKLYISADVICERESHKRIVIGKGGSMLRTIGTEARQELEGLLDTPIYMELFVKVVENWRNSGSILKELGYFE